MLIVPGTWFKRVVLVPLINHGFVLGATYNKLSRVIVFKESGKLEPGQIATIMAVGMVYYYNDTRIKKHTSLQKKRICV